MSKEDFMAYAEKRIKDKKYNELRKKREIDNYVKSAICTKGGLI